jgi:hypothetical protein
MKAGGCVAKFFKIRGNARFLAIEKPMISFNFKGAHFPKNVILHAVFFYVGTFKQTTLKSHRILLNGLSSNTFSLFLASQK